MGPYRLPTVAIALLAGCLLASENLMAQDPRPSPTLPQRPVRTAPKPTVPTTVSPATPGNVAAKPIEQTVLAVDLQIALSPLSPTAVPTQFTVKNAGFGAAEKPSLLRVTVTLLNLPPTTTCSGDLSSPAAQMACTLGGLLNSSYQYSQLMEVCPAPLKSFEAEIQPLEPGQSQVVTQSSPSPFMLIANLGPQQNKTSYFKNLTLVCVFEIKAQVDANGDIAESNEQNNEFFHYVEREIQWK